MSQLVDVAIIGAGPYGLSLAAQLRATGLSFRIFGKPLDTWRHHMPKGMFLKSEGFASNLSAPDDQSTLMAYCAARGLDYADRRLPVSLDTFNAYADWFRLRHVPMLEQLNVTALDRKGDKYILMLEDGEELFARHVVLAVGITWFQNMPESLAHLPAHLASHAYAHHDVTGFKGRDVTVLGAGASAIDLAAALAEEGANVQILARAPSIRFHTAPDPSEDSFLHKLQSPPTGIGPGWRSFFCVNTPLLFHRLPESLRLRATKRHLGPAPGWFMRERIEGIVQTMLGHEIVSAKAYGDQVTLDVVDATGTQKLVVADHVIAATGYKPDLTKLPFLAPMLRASIAQVQNTAILSDNFETSSRGLYMTGPAAANSFGPLMRFMYGAEFAAPRLAQHLKRRLEKARMPQPANSNAKIRTRAA
jgi:thioredoxin reductase